MTKKFHDIELNIFKNLLTNDVPVHFDPAHFFDRNINIKSMDDSKQFLLDMFNLSIDTAFKANNFYYFSKKLNEHIRNHFYDMIKIDDVQILLKEIIEDSGVFIDDNRYTFYNIKNGHAVISIYDIYNGKIYLYSGAEFFDLHKECSIRLYYNSYLDNTFEINEEEAKVMLNRENLLTLYKIVFKKFIDVETVQVVKDKAKLNSIKYINKSNYPITIIDSTYYKNIIRDAAFGVQGHFRLQPYGPKRSLNKLIWIKPFTKPGYVRKARKLKTEDNELSIKMQTEIL